MSFVRRSIAPRSGVGTEVSASKMLDDYYGFNRLLELVQGGMGDSLWDAGDSHVLSAKKYGKTGGVTGTGTAPASVLQAQCNRTSVGAGGGDVLSYTVGAGISKVAANGVIDGQSATLKYVRIRKNGVDQTTQGHTSGSDDQHSSSNMARILMSVVQGDVITVRIDGHPTRPQYGTGAIYSMAF